MQETWPFCRNHGGCLVGKAGHPGFAEGALAGSGKAGPAPALPQAGCVGLGMSTALSGSQLSHLSGEGSGFKIRRVSVCQCL